MSAKDLKNEREILIAEIAEIIAVKYFNSYSEYLQLPLIEHPLVTTLNYNILVKFPRWYEKISLTSKRLNELWINNNYTAEEIEFDILALSKIEHELKSTYEQYNEASKLRDLINKYK